MKVSTLGSIVIRQDNGVSPPSQTINKCSIINNAKHYSFRCQATLRGAWFILNCRAERCYVFLCVLCVRSLPRFCLVRGGELFSFLLLFLFFLHVLHGEICFFVFVFCLKRDRRHSLFDNDKSRVLYNKGCLHPDYRASLAMTI